MCSPIENAYIKHKHIALNAIERQNICKIYSFDMQFETQIWRQRTTKKLTEPDKVQHFALEKQS